MAQKLHHEQPDKFPDPNHKPEIAVALSRFEAFVGWKPLRDISVLFNIPGLRELVPEVPTGWTDDTLRTVTRRLLQADSGLVRLIEAELMNLSKRDLEDLDHQSYILDLIPRLQSQYDATDPGTLVALLCMNYLVLEPGEALYIPADSIHAYLSGDIVECAARSTNAMRSGFCPRADRDDVELFTEALTFAQHHRDDARLLCRPSEAGLRGRTVVYQPPIREFDLLRVELAPGQEEEVSAARGPAVAIITKGEGVLGGDGREFTVTEGFVFFVAPGTAVRWRTESGLQVYMPVVEST